MSYCLKTSWQFPKAGVIFIPTQQEKTEVLAQACKWIKSTPSADSPFPHLFGVYNFLIDFFDVYTLPHLFLAALDAHLASSSCGGCGGGVYSPVAVHRLQGPQASAAAAQGLSSCGPQDLLLRDSGDCTCVACIGRRILIHCGTRDVLGYITLKCLIQVSLLKHFLTPFIYGWGSDRKSLFCSEWARLMLLTQYLSLGLMPCLATLQSSYPAVMLWSRLPHLGVPTSQPALSNAGRGEVVGVCVGVQGRVRESKMQL